MVADSWCRHFAAARRAPPVKKRAGGWLQARATIRILLSIQSGAPSPRGGLALAFLKRRLDHREGSKRVFEKVHAGASRLSMMRMVAMSIMASDVCTAYS